MKKTLVILIVIAGLFTSCNDLGNKAETTEAQTVEQNFEGPEMLFNKIDQDSRLKWRATHLAGVQPRFGQISIKNSEVLVANDKIKNAKFIIDMNSLSVENFVDDEENKMKLTSHLLSSDFFNTEVFPESIFELTNIESNEGDYNSIVTGNLKILDVTKSIKFKANITIKDIGIKISSEDFSVDRRDWGLTYNTEGTEGVPTDYLIANDIGFKLELKIVQ